MQVTVNGRHTTVPPALRERSIRQVRRFASFLGGMERAEVRYWEETTSRTPDRWICDLTVEGRGHTARARVAAPSQSAALDAAVEKVERQLRRVKTERERRLHGRQRPELPPELVPEHLVATT